MRVRQRRRLARLVIGSAMSLMLMSSTAAVANLPASVAMRSGATAVFPASAMLAATVQGKEGVARVSRERCGADELRVSALEAGSARLTYRLLGIVPVRTVGVTVTPERRLVPAGQTVGVAIDTKGVIVVGASDLGNTPSPARLAGIRSGDIICAIDGRQVDSAETLRTLITSGEEVDVEVMRDGKAFECEITPRQDPRDGSWRLGVWVRDSTAGIGTLTFVDPDSGVYGALGHAITDVDTSVAMPVGSGELYANSVVDVTPSESGTPGELTGDFIFHADAVGTVERNTDRGIYGRLNGAPVNSLYPQGLPAAEYGDIHEGRATVIVTVDEEGPREYDCEVVRLNASAGNAAQAMVIRMTDADLIRRTGGIVQGMSGSPLIQDGRLIGAVTHVMVNDPEMGYAIPIGAMLEEADGIIRDTEERGAAA